MKTIEADVVIVGGGIIGCASAYYLSQAGKQVALLEKGVIGGEASGRNLGGVRQQGRHPYELPLAMESIRLWQDLDRELDCDTEYRRWGNLYVAKSAEHLQWLMESAEEDKRLGLEVRILDRVELKELVPALSADFMGAKYCPTDGHANPINTTLGFARAARRAGAQLFPRCEARSIGVANGRVASVQTSDLKISAGKVVNAAGAWAGEVGRMVGLELPIGVLRNQVMVTEPLPAAVKPFVISAELDAGCRQAANGNVHVGGGETVDVGKHSASREVTMPVMRCAAQGVAMLVPRLRGARIIRSWGGFDALTPDGLPMIGAVDGVEGFILATGFSNHGFALGPAVGKLIEEMIVDGRVSPLVEQLTPGRFGQVGN